MAFRAVYIIDPKPDGSKSSIVLFKRAFPVAEKKCKQLLGEEKYSKIPINFADLILDELELKRANNEEFIKRFDSCTVQKTPPIYNLFNEPRIPVVAFQKLNFIYCCLVLEESLNVEPRIISSGVVFAYSMLQNMAFVMGAGNTAETAKGKLQLLHKYVSIGFPFGIPTELNVNTIFAMASTADGTPLPKIKGPAWRPVAYRGKQTFYLCIKEKVRALQFDHSDIPDKCEVFGTIVCKVDVEQSPEITINLIAALDSTVLNQMVYHPAIQLIDVISTTMIDEKKSGDEMQFGSRKLRFCPPFDEFYLCHYKARVSNSQLPVQAFYQMKGNSKTATILIQLKLSPNMKNHFDYFEVTIPFFNRGPVVSVKTTPASANVSVKSDKTMMVWNIGNKFPGKTNDISLEATVNFNDSLEHIVHDKFLIGLNSYIWIAWKVTDFTYSGIKFDSKSVELYPSSKIKVISASDLRTIEYKVWNSHGDVTNASFMY